MSARSRIVALREADAHCGGKAAGLRRLLEAGLPVPDGFVVVDVSAELDTQGVVAAARALGAARVAVRSSAIGEDGAAASFAGQFETVLNVADEAGLVAAVQHCIEAASAERVQDYARAQTTGASSLTEFAEPSGPPVADPGVDSAGSMSAVESAGHGYSNTADSAPQGRQAAQLPRLNLVVQTMVDARAAGVAFTVDPVSGRRDQIVVDAVSGLGESLVSGERTPDHFVLQRDGDGEQRDLVGVEPVLSQAELALLKSQALHAEAAAGTPVDLEWAIDAQGALWWLQMRPVTALPPDPRALDYQPPRPDDVLTRANIGEMMPGAVTPLTWSVTAYGIEHAMQEMFVRVGLQHRQLPGYRFVALAFGQMMLNLSTMVAMAGAVAGSTRQALCVSICGRDVPQLPEPQRAGGSARILNSLRYFHYAFTAPRWIARFEPRAAALRLEEKGDAVRLWCEIDRKLAVLWECFDVHLASSTGSGLAAGILDRRLAGLPEEERAARIADLLAGAGDVESADVAAAIEDVGGVLRAHPQAGDVAAMNDEALLTWLRSAESAEVGRRWNHFLTRHGHRSLRELELRQPAWRDDPVSVLAALRAALSITGQAGAKTKMPPPSQHVVSDRVLAWGRAAVRRREYTKSMLVRVTDVFKLGYRRLGHLLVEAERLEDADQVFFLKHEELGECLLRPASTPSGAPTWSALASERRRALDYQMSIALPEVTVGLPRDPQDAQPASQAHERGSAAKLQGRVVSRGRVVAPARVVRSLAEAAAVRPGEILVAPVTDVGWTPYFAVIAGLATDIGSAVSHGAVVAREYGLPAVVNLGNATSVFRTGEILILDADAGTLARCENEPAGAATGRAAEIADGRSTPAADDTKQTDTGGDEAAQENTWMRREV